MFDDLAAAHERARELVGESVWVRLSETVRANAVDEELRMLNAERAASIPDGIAGNTRTDSTAPSFLPPR